MGQKDRITVKEGQHFWLDKPEDVLNIFSATVEIYAVDLDPQTSALRTYITSLEPGEAFIGAAIQPLNVRLLALTVKEGEIGFSDWNSLFFDKYSLDKLNKILSVFLNWSPVPVLSPHVYKELICGETFEILENEVLKTNHPANIFWIKLLEGKISLSGFSEENVELNEIVPLSLARWLQAAENSKVHIYSTEEILAFSAPEEFIAYFQKEQERFLKRIQKHFISQLNQRLDKINQKKVHNQVMIKQALSELIKNDIPQLAQVAIVPSSNASPLLPAIKLIAAHLNVLEQKIKIPPDLPQSLPTKDVIKYAALSGNMVSRPVKLDKDWHTQDQGPLLVFKDGCPLAALPKDRSSYILIDPVSFTRTVADETIILDIDETAYTFYKCLPARQVKLSEYLKHSIELCFPKDFWILLFACLIAGIVPIVMPLITQTIFEDIIPNFDKQAHLIVVQVMFVTAASTALINLSRSIAFIRLKNKIHLVAESSLWLKLLSLPSSFFRTYQVGGLALRMQNINVIFREFSGVVASSMFNGIFSFWNLLVMFYYSTKLALVAVLVWFVYLVVSVYFSWRMVKFQRRHTEAAGELSSRTLELLNGLSKFRTRAAENRAFYLWSNKFGQDWKWNRACRWQPNWLGLIGQVQPLILTMLIFYLSIHWMDEGLKNNLKNLSQPDFIAFNAALGAFGASLSGLIASTTTFFSLMPLLERLKPILAEEPEASETKVKVGRLTGSLEIVNVSFRYNKSTPLVLKDVSFNILPGEFLTIVGASGSGKSTLLRLLIGLEKPERGVIQYDGQNLSEIDVTSVRRQLGVVMQEGRLMSGSILDNIIGSIPLTRQDALDAACMVGLDNDIKEMPMGIDTVISEGAGNISGGQRQRILIARCLVNQPRIVVFDEATSSLDNHTQAIVAATLEKLKATRIVVAHRLSTIQKADRIIVLDKGSIIESGNYAELMDKNGFFAALANRQIC